MERSIPERNDARVRRSQDGLRNALLDLLTERAFEDITVREIAERAGVGYTTFFRHFAGKDDLLDTVVKLEIDRLTERSLPIYDAADGLGACLAFCAYVDEHRLLWSALLAGGAAAKVREEMRRQSREQIAARAVERSLPADLSSALAIAAIFELLSWWLRQTMPWPADAVGAILYDRIVKPLTEGQ